MTDAEALRLYQTLTRIAHAYETPRELRHTAETHSGLSYTAALEIAYDHIQADARRALKGIRLAPGQALGTRKEAP